MALDLPLVAGLEAAPKVYAFGLQSAGPRSGHTNVAGPFKARFHRR